MDPRRQFLVRLAERVPARLEQAVALLWYYEQTQLYTERSVTDIVHDVEDLGFGRQNVGRLRDALRRSRLTVNGTARDTFRINAARFPELTEKYGNLLDIVEPEATSSVIPVDFVSGTRTYIERLVKQINASYDAGSFDASAVILRRLMESILIEVYITAGRQAEIKQGAVFMQLSDLITHIANDTNVNKSRNLVQGLGLIKDIGDTAAHHRTYITPKQDIDDNRTAMRRVIHELLVLAGIR
ncbi:MAG: hypothetical protein KBE09_04735 [Candidatus Pacebacteria bacterium]|nr:hypothetical protein [Candidatus Paceibacterota bacterium]